MKSLRPDHFFLGLTVGLALIGFFIFSSASLGLVSRSGASFSLVVGKQLAILVIGLLVGALVSKINYQYWRRYAWLLLIIGVGATALVLVPGVGVAAGGARRWLAIWGLSFQPSELLRLGGIIYLAAWFSAAKHKTITFASGLLPLMIWLAGAGALLLLEPDTDTFVVLAISSLVIFFVAGGRWRDLLLLGLIGAIGLAYFFTAKPYLEQRFISFLEPASDLQGAGYQANQSLIALGSGGIVGRGFGQSVQKFYYLPQPIGDSIFAVAGEEFGLIGTVSLVIMYLLWGWWGLKIAARAPDQFARLLTVGIVVSIITQSFFNMASMLRLIPLAGAPLLFVSHGGTALLFALIEAGIIINISRYQT